MTPSSILRPAYATNPPQPETPPVGTGWNPAESFGEALIQAVRACGGSKVVAAAIWPAKSIEDARRHLANCLNDDRPEKLGLDELVLILRMAREAGCHTAVGWLLEHLSYAAPVPVEPQDQADDLRRQFIESTRALAKLAERIESLDQRGARRA